MLTGRGWALLGSAVVSLIAGRLLGLEEVFVVGAGMAGAILVALGYVFAVRFDLDASRRVLPGRVHAGAGSRVELSLVNRSAHRTPVLTVRDPFDGGARWARFLVAPLARGELARAAYRLPTDQRGIFDLGPLKVGLVDPFGLAARTADAAPATRLTVYPRIDDVAPPASAHGDDPLAGADHPRALTGGGEDFYALRPYVRGDDLRRVHWPSTAKADELMLRQDEMPWQARSALLLDTRSSMCPPQALELLVSAAASIVVAAGRHDGLVRLITTGGFDSRTGAGNAHVESILEHLAGVRASAGELLPVLSNVRRSVRGGAFVVLTTRLAPAADLAAVGALRSRFGSLTLVVVEPAAWTSEPVVTGALPAGLRLVRIGPGRPFADGWTAAVGPPRTPARSTRRRTPSASRYPAPAGPGTTPTPGPPS